jgi:hypothetical protein
MFYGGQSGIANTPLLSYSDRQERATLVRDLVDGSHSMPPRKRGVGRRPRAAGKGRKRKSTSHRRVKGAKGVRVTKGRVAIRLAGHGVTKLAASQLVRYVPLSKLKSAAKKVLRSLGHSTTKRKGRKRKGRKRKGRRKKRRRTRR